MGRFSSLNQWDTDLAFGLGESRKRLTPRSGRDCQRRRFGGRRGSWVADQVIERPQGGGGALAQRDHDLLVGHGRGVAGGEHGVRGFLAAFDVNTGKEVWRFYTVPGLGHGYGVFNPAWDALGALDNWVTNGVAPDNVVGFDQNTATYGRTRPLCRYPSFPKYSGSGSNLVYSNFSCVKPG